MNILIPIYLKKSGFLGTLTSDKVDKFDYWGLFRVAVKQFNIAPSEAWGLDIVDVIYLLEQENNTHIDTSIMLNFQRKLNGACSQWLQNH